MPGVIDVRIAIDPLDAAGLTLALAGVRANASFALDLPDDEIDLLLAAAELTLLSTEAEDEVAIC